MLALVAVFGSAIECVAAKHLFFKERKIAIVQRAGGPPLRSYGHSKLANATLA
jgi:hypothetical protein